MVECFFNDPKKWGNHVWYMLDMMIIRLDPKDAVLKNHILMQFISLMETIPCEKCRGHYKEYIRKNPIEGALIEKPTLAKWVYELKTEINKREKKPNISFLKYVIDLKYRFKCDIMEKIEEPTLIYSTIDPLVSPVQEVSD